MTLMTIIKRPFNRRTAVYPLTQPLAALPRFVRKCPVAQRYHRLLSGIDWNAFPERDLNPQGRHAPTPYRPFVAACLVKLDQNKSSMGKLHTYLLEHPALMYLLDFPVGKAGASALPSARHFTRLLRTMPNAVCQFLLDESVRLLQAALQDDTPDFGHAIALDTKHILAWVRENNPKAFVTDRYNKANQPAGDPDCRLGCKKRHNQHGDVEWTPTHNPVPASGIEVGEFHWGYASGVVATKVPGRGEFVLAEFTQPFDCSDVSYFFPLLAATERRLGFRPRFGAFDAAFDAHYVYAHFHREGACWQDGFAAVPYTQRNGTARTFSPDGHPICPAGGIMRLQFQFMRRNTLYEHQCDHYVCPCKGSASSCPIDHPKWARGGCTTRLPSGPGSRVRHQIDRQSEPYKVLYRQRTATERINALAKELGIERPHLRNQVSITNHNTLIYVLLNLRALRRILHD